jgi:hypothetical protein
MRFISVFIALFMVSCMDYNLGQIPKPGQSGISEAKVIQGLREALNVGTANSVIQLNKKNGYFGNARLKIPFPKDAEFVKNTVKAVPVIGPKLVDTLVLKLNRAAEHAAVKAKPVFVNAISKINITDAMSILNGSNNAATQYLKSKTYSELVLAFKPDIIKSLDAVGAQKAWKDVTSKYNSLPFAKKVNTDLAKYTTEKALDGLFLIIADEEAKIRKDPAARVSDILKQVFGK